MDTQWVLSQDGQGWGTFLSPPGHASLRYTLKGYEVTAKGNRRKEPLYLGGIEGADLSMVPDAMAERIRGLLSRKLDGPSEPWLRQVYGYFRNMYSVDGTRNVSAAKSARELTPEQRDPSRHLAVMCVREYFPDHAPRTDLIDPAPGLKLYGAWPCAHCGTPVQYEPRVDGLSVAGRNTKACDPSPTGEHEWSDKG